MLWPLAPLVTRGKDASRRSQALTQRTDTGSGSDGPLTGPRRDQDTPPALPSPAQLRNQLGFPTRQVRGDQREVSLRQEETNSRRCARKGVRCGTQLHPNFYLTRSNISCGIWSCEQVCLATTPCSLTYKPGNLVVPGRLLGERPCSQLCATFAKLKRN